MSRFHCSCGFGIDAEDEFRDHLLDVFSPADEIGCDGRQHAELTDEWVVAAGGMPAGGLRAHQCACGVAADVAEEFDDHLLLVFTPAGGVGRDGVRHVPADVSTPVRYLVAGGGDGQGRPA